MDDTKLTGETVMEKLDDPITWGRIAITVLDDLKAEDAYKKAAISLVEEDPLAAYNDVSLWRNITLFLFLESIKLKKTDKNQE